MQPELYERVASTTPGLKEVLEVLIQHLDQGNTHQIHLYQFLTGHVYDMPIHMETLQSDFPRQLWTDNLCFVAWRNLYLDKTIRVSQLGIKQNDPRDPLGLLKKIIREAPTGSNLIFRDIVFVEYYPRQRDYRIHVNKYDQNFFTELVCEDFDLVRDVVFYSIRINNRSFESLAEHHLGNFTD